MHSLHFKSQVCAPIDREPVCTCVRVTALLMLSAGKVHVTLMIYEPEARGAVFQYFLTGEACFFKLSSSLVLCILLPNEKPLLNKSWRGQRVTAQHWNGMFLPGSRSSLQRGPEIIWDHRHMLHLFYSLRLCTFVCRRCCTTLVLLHKYLVFRRPDNPDSTRVICRKYSA